MNSKSIVLTSSKGDFARYKNTEFNKSETTSFDGLEALTLKDVALSVVLSNLDEKYSSVKVLSDNHLSMILYLILRCSEENGELSFFKDKMITLSLSKEIQKNLKLLRMNRVFSSNSLNTNPRLRDIKLINSKLDMELEKLSDRFKVLVLDKSKLFERAIDVISNDELFIPNIVFTFKKYNLNELTQLEEDFIKSLSTYTKSSIDDVFPLNTYDIEELPNVIKNIHFTSSYGVHNEIHGVIDDILTNNIQISDIEILFSNTNELNLAKNELDRLGLPYKSTINDKGIDTEVYSILKTIFDIDELEFSPHRGDDKLSGFKSYIAYKTDKRKIPSFFSFLMDNRETPNICCKEFIKETVNFIKEVFENDISLPFISLLNEYSLLTRDEDSDSLSNLKEIVLDIIKNTCIPSNEIINDAHLLLGTLSSLPNEVGRNIYILGLDGNSFASLVVDSPSLPDSEKLLLGIKNTDFNMTKKSYARKERKLLEFLSLVSRIDNLHLTLSYVAFDSISVQETNQSSFYMRLKSASGVSDFDVKRVDFSTKTFIKEEENDCSNDGSDTNATKYKIEPHRITNFSASVIDSLFMECPKKFYFNQVLKIKKDEEEIDTSGIWLEAKDKGLLIHEVLSTYVNRAIINGDVDIDTLKFDKNTLRKRAMDISNQYNIKSINNIDDIPLLSNIFNNVVNKYFNSYPCKESVFNESKKECEEAVLSEVKHILSNITHRFPIATEWSNDIAININGLNFKKYRIDRIDYDFDKDSLVIIDYKTKTTSGIIKMNKKRTVDDTLRQDYIYSYIVDEFMSKNSTDKTNLKVSDTVYRFVLSGKELQSQYNDEAKAKLLQTMEDISTCCESGIFEETQNKDVCTYCDYKTICKDILEKPEENKEDEIE